MKLTILGNNGPYPASNAACSGYLLESDSGKTHVLIDCGTGVLAQLVGRSLLPSLDAVLLSHLHFDHMSEMCIRDRYSTAQPMIMVFTMWGICVLTGCARP